MHRLNRITLSLRIVLSFSAAIAAVLMLGFFISGRMRDDEKAFSSDLKSADSATFEVEKLYALSLRAGYDQSLALQGALPPSNAEESANQFDSQLQRVMSRGLSHGQDTLEQIQSIWAQIRQASPMAQSVSVTKTPKVQRAGAQSSTSPSQYPLLQSDIKGLLTSQKEALSLAEARAAERAQALRDDLWNVISFLVLGTIGIAFFYYRTLTHPLKVLTKATQEISGGKWGSRVDLDSRDEFGDLARALNAMSVDIGKLINYLNEVGTPVYAVDEQFTIQFANTAAVNASGRSYEDIVEKKKCYDIFRLPVCRTPDCPVSKAWKSRKKVSGESSAYLGGISTPVLYQSSTVSDANGNVIRGVEVLTDITEIKNFSQKIEAQRLYLSDSVNVLLQNMSKLADGDLTLRLDVRTTDEIGSLFEGFNKAVGNFRSMMEQVVAAVSETANTAAQISSSTEQLAAGAQEQSSQAREVATTIEQVTATVITNSKNATMAAEAARDNGEVATEGGTKVKKTVSKMKEIAEVVRQSSETISRLGNFSREIGEIVSVIGDIADQTNLLALNAAIEAARAGEGGKGFAVVADEVRKLAERTTQATKKISTMIKDVQSGTDEAVRSIEHGNKEVSEGIRLADDAGDSLDNIVRNAQEVVETIKQIAAANHEQASASEQLAKNIQSISDVSSESAAGIAQIAQAADSLNQLTSGLQQLAGEFKVGAAIRTMPGKVRTMKAPAERP